MAIRKISRHHSRVKAWIGYGVYTLVLLGCFLYLLFPYQDVQRWLEHQLAQRMGIQIDAEERKAGPFWLEWKGLRFLSGKLPWIEQLEFPWLRFDFRTRSLLGGPLQISSVMSVWEGKGEGWLVLITDSPDYQFRVVHSWDHLDLEDVHLPYIQGGTISLELDYQWAGDAIGAGHGQGKFSGESVRVETLPIASDEVISLTLSSTTGLVTKQEGEVRLTEFQAQGEGFHLSGHGHIQDVSQIVDSPLGGEFTVFLGAAVLKQFPQLQYLQVSLGQPIHLTLTGSLRNPSLVVNGLPVQVDTAPLFN